MSWLSSSFSGKKGHIVNWGRWCAPLLITWNRISMRMYRPSNEWFCLSFSSKLCFVLENQQSTLISVACHSPFQWIISSRIFSPSILLLNSNVNDESLLRRHYHRKTSVAEVDWRIRWDEIMLVFPDRRKFDKNRQYARSRVSWLNLFFESVIGVYLSCVDELQSRGNVSSYHSYSFFSFSLHSLDTFHRIAA